VSQISGVCRLLREAERSQSITMFLILTSQFSGGQRFVFCIQLHYYRVGQKTGPLCLTSVFTSSQCLNILYDSGTLQCLRIFYRTLRCYISAVLLLFVLNMSVNSNLIKFITLWCHNGESRQPE